MGVREKRKGGGGGVRGNDLNKLQCFKLSWILAGIDIVNISIVELYLHFNNTDKS